MGKLQIHFNTKWRNNNWRQILLQGKSRFIVTLLERNETNEKVSLSLKIEDILWRQGRYGVGDKFTCTCTKTFYYPIWWIWTLEKGLQNFIDNIPSIPKLKEKYPDLDLNKKEDRIRLIKIAYGREVYTSRKTDG